MNARDIPAAIHWHEGLLLTPQHFQQLTSRHEALVQYGAAIHTPFCWGLRRFKHDPSSLLKGVLQVVELEAVMPDGLVVSHDHSPTDVSHDRSSTDSDLKVQLADLKECMTDRSVSVYLTVMASQSGSSNGGGDRYEQFNGGLVSDRASHGMSREIFRLRPKLKLVPVLDSLPAKYIGFPLAKLRYTDSFRLDENFIPPLLALPTPSAGGEPPVSGANALREMCSAAAQRIRDRATVLLREDTRGSNQFQTLPAGDIARLEIMMKRQRMLSVVGTLPILEAMLQCGGLHPLTLYLALCNVAGHLSVLGTDMVPDPFAPYNHNDLYATFKPVIEFIERTLDVGVPVSCKSFHFHFKDQSFQLQFQGAWKSKQLALAIRGPHEMSETALIRWGESCLIASEGKIDEIRKNRTTGVPRSYAARIGDVGPEKGVVLFALPDATQIEPNRTLHILNDGTWPTDIVLHVFEDKAISK